MFLALNVIFPEKKKLGKLFQVLIFVDYHSSCVTAVFKIIIIIIMFSFNYLYNAFSKWWYTENDPDHHYPDYDETALLPGL